MELVAENVHAVHVRAADDREERVADGRSDLRPARSMGRNRRAKETEARGLARDRDDPGATVIGDLWERAVIRFWTRPFEVSS